MSETIGELGGSVNSAVLPVNPTDLIPIEQGGISKNTYISNLVPGLTGVLRIVQTIVVPAGNQATITLTFPVGFMNARISIVGRGTAASEVSTISIIFNGDTGANYDICSFAFQTSTTTQLLGQTSMALASFNSATATANYPSQIELQIDNYPGTVFYQSVLSQWSQRVSNSSGGGALAGIWKHAGAISTATLSLASGSFLAGTQVTLLVQ